jgi:hypothetical protein
MRMKHRIGIVVCDRSQSPRLQWNKEELNEVTPDVSIFGLIGEQEPININKFDNIIIPIDQFFVTLAADQVSNKSNPPGVEHFLDHSIPVHRLIIPRTTYEEYGFHVVAPGR